MRLSIAFSAGLNFFMYSSVEIAVLRSGRWGLSSSIWYSLNHLIKLLWLLVNTTYEISFWVLLAETKLRMSISFVSLSFACSWASCRFLRSFKHSSLVQQQQNTDKRSVVICSFSGYSCGIRFRITDSTSSLSSSSIWFAFLLLLSREYNRLKRDLS